MEIEISKLSIGVKVHGMMLSHGSLGVQLVCTKSAELVQQCPAHDVHVQQSLGHFWHTGMVSMVWCGMYIHVIIVHIATSCDPICGLCIC